MEDYGIKFERVVNYYLGTPEKEEWWSGYYLVRKDALSILYTICAKEIMVNRSKYSKEELNLLFEMEEILSRENINSNSLNSIIDAIDLLEKLVK